MTIQPNMRHLCTIERAQTLEGAYAIFNIQQWNVQGIEDLWDKRMTLSNSKFALITHHHPRTLDDAQDFDQNLRDENITQPLTQDDFVQLLREEELPLSTHYKHTRAILVQKINKIKILRIKAIKIAFQTIIAHLEKTVFFPEATAALAPVRQSPPTATEALAPVRQSPPAATAALAPVRQSPPAATEALAPVRQSPPAATEASQTSRTPGWNPEAKAWQVPLGGRPGQLPNNNDQTGLAQARRDPSAASTEGRTESKQPNNSTSHRDPGFAQAGNGSQPNTLRWTSEANQTPLAPGLNPQAKAWQVPLSTEGRTESKQPNNSTSHWDPGFAQAGNGSQPNILRWTSEKGQLP